MSYNAFWYPCRYTSPAKSPKAHRIFRWSSCYSWRWGENSGQGMFWSLLRIDICEWLFVPDNGNYWNWRSSTNRLRNDWRCQSDSPFSRHLWRRYVNVTSIWTYQPSRHILLGQSTAFKWYASGCRTLDDILEGKGGIKLTPAQEIGIRFYDG